MPVFPATFPKTERIVSRKLIEALFSPGASQSRAAFPLRAVWQVVERQPGEEQAQVLMSVSKKRLRHAVDRNRVKRQLREAWRLNRGPLLAALPEGKRVVVAFVWLSDELFDTSSVTARIQRLLRRIGEQL